MISYNFVSLTLYFSSFLFCHTVRYDSKDFCLCWYSSQTSISIFHILVNALAFRFVSEEHVELPSVGKHFFTSLYSCNKLPFSFINYPVFSMSYKYISEYEADFRVYFLYKNIYFRNL